MPKLIFQSPDGVPIEHSWEGAETVSIGRHPDNVIRLESSAISNFHAFVAQTQDGYAITDLGSTNGTMVNKREARQSSLTDGDQVSVGDFSGVFLDTKLAEGSEDGSSATDSLGFRRAAFHAPAAAVLDEDDEEDKPKDSAPAAPHPSSVVRRAPAMAKPTLATVRVPLNPGQQTTSRKKSGVGGAIFAMLMLGLFAFAVGLAFRHHQDTGRNFFKDAIESLTGGKLSMGKPPVE